MFLFSLTICFFLVAPCSACCFILSCSFFPSFENIACFLEGCFFWVSQKKIRQVLDIQYSYQSKHPVSIWLVHLQYLLRKKHGLPPGFTQSVVKEWFHRQARRDLTVLIHPQETVDLPSLRNTLCLREKNLPLFVTTTRVNDHGFLVATLERPSANQVPTLNQ